MGRRWKKSKSKRLNGIQRKGANPRHFDGNHKPEGNQNYTLSWQTNRRMEAYFAYQGVFDLYWDEETKSYRVCTTDEQKTAEAVKWMTSVKRILPASFRIGVDVDPIVRERLKQELEDLVGKEMEMKVDDGVTIRLAPAKCIPFIPHAYQLAIDRHTIRKNESLSKLFEWLKIQTEAGFVTRQETVSMIPPIVMDIQSHHQVLDMCAAPGSKTSQILEIISAIPKGMKEPLGCVVANDADPKRAYMLVHQLKRIHSPVALVTSCDAQFFPLLKHISQQDASPEGLFDRVLADVPCSGDGTMRKNPQVWKKWSCLNSLSLHPMQLAIALNGARLTKVGGYLCYSTCAMSPVENEAVVAELLRVSDGALELVDRREHMEGIKARPGWSHWKVMREDMSNRKAKNQAKKKSAKMEERRREFEKPVNGKTTIMTTSTDQEDSEAADEQQNQNGEEKELHADVMDCDGKIAETEEPVPLGPPTSWEADVLKARCDEEGLTEYKSYDEVEENWRRTLRRSVFPPSQEEAKTMQLHKCLRLLSHDMDTSGFFVALFKKVQPLSQRARDKSVKLAAELRSDVGDDEGRERPLATKRTKLNNDELIVTEALPEDAPAEVSVASSLGKIVKGKNPRGAYKGNMGNENFVPANESHLVPLMSYYGFDDNFPKDQIMARASGDSKVFSFIGKAVKKYIEAGIQDRITIINSGLKCFERNNNECEVSYRVAQEGIHFLSPYMKNRKFVVSIQDFLTCFSQATIKITALSPNLAEGIRNIAVGSFLVALEGYEDDVSLKLMMVMWRCRGDNINCLVCKIERDGMRSKMRAITGLDLRDDEPPADVRADDGETMNENDVVVDDVIKETGVDLAGEGED